MESEAEQRLKDFLAYLEEGKKKFNCDIYPVFTFDGQTGPRGELKIVALNPKKEDG